MRVLVQPADIHGCGHYRLIMAAEHLRSEGHDVIVSWPFTGKNGMEVMMEDGEDGISRMIDFRLPYEDVDVIVMQRISHGLHVQAVPLLRKRGIAVVVDMDDNLSCIHPKNKAFWNYRAQSSSPFSHKNADQVCRDATLVTVSTRELLKTYVKHGRGHVIDNYVPERYLYINQPRVDAPVFGWGGTYKSHPTDLPVVGRAVQELVSEGHRFKIIGPGEPEVMQQLRLTSPPEATGVVQMFDWPTALAELDVGMAPLEPSTFNTGKCLDAQTRVSTSRGILPIVELVEGDQVWRNEAWSKVEAVNIEAPKSGLLITTDYGRQLKLTPEHRLWVNGAWKPVKELHVDATIGMTPDHTYNGKFLTAPWPSDSRMSPYLADPIAFETAPDVPKVTINERWGRFLGLFAGDGCATGTRICISCDGQDADLIAMISADCRTMGLWPATEHAQTWGGQPLRRRSITTSSTHLIRFLRGLGVVERQSVRRTVTVPEAIWRSPKRVIAAYLAGLFEADGTVQGTQVAFTTKHAGFAADIQRLLVAFGIQARIRARSNTAGGSSGTKRFTSYLLTMGRAGADIFETEIGFLSARKQARLAQVTARPHSNAYRPMTWIERIISIETCTVTPVDIQVEGEAFAAAGFLSHNSRLKPLEYAAVGVPCVISPRAEYYRFHKESQGACLLADTPKQWATGIRQLLTDDTRRKEMSEQCRTFAATQTVELNSWRWLEAWTQAYDIQRGKA